MVFINKSGGARVEREQYFIMYAQGGRLLREASCQHAIKRDDHLSMSMILSELSARQGQCLFPSCLASIGRQEIRNGGRLCLDCGRSAVLMPTEPLNGSLRLLEARGQSQPEELTEEADPSFNSKTDSIGFK